MRLQMVTGSSPMVMSQGIHCSGVGEEQEAVNLPLVG
jgi:hypothetical protein